MSREIASIIGGNIKMIRKEKNLTQGDLAHIMKLGKSGFTYLSDVENGKVGTSEEQLVRIASALNVDVKDLYNGIEERRASAGERRTTFTVEDETKLYEDLKKLPKEDKSFIMQCVVLLKKNERLSNEEDKILKMYRRLDPEGKQILEIMIRGLLNQREEEQLKVSRRKAG